MIANNPLHNLNLRGAYCELADLLRLRFAAQDLKLSARRPARSLLTGGERTRMRGRGIDFEEVRLYQPGDDIRTIDWRVTARTQVPHTKLFREERERPLLIVADQRANMFFGSRQCFKSVTAASIATTLAWAALHNSDRVGGLVFGDNAQHDVRPRRSKHAVLEILQHLISFNKQLTTPVAGESRMSLAVILTDLRRIAKPGSALFICSDFHDFDDACEQQLFELSRHTEVTLMHVFDPLERQLSSNVALTISNGQQRCVLPANDRAFQQAWQADYEQRLGDLVKRCKRLQVPMLSYSTADDIQGLLRESYSAMAPKKKHHRN
jgi:uncharacterized protein (DUF58 family)